MPTFDYFFNSPIEGEPISNDGLKKTGILKATGIFPAESMSADSSCFEAPTHLRQLPMNQTVRTTKPSSVNLHHLQRDFLLHKAGLPPTKKRNNTRNGILGNTAPAPPPYNSQPAWGPCLIWRGTLTGTKTGTNGGYGIHRRRLVHRTVFQESRQTTLPKDLHVLHLCHRRSCIQPSHLYAGTDKDNAEDRQQRFSDERRGGWTRVNQEWDRATQQYPYNVPALDLRIEPVWLNHQCVPSIHAGDAKLCLICDMTPSQVQAIPTMQNIKEWDHAFPQQDWHHEESTIPRLSMWLKGQSS